MREIEVIDSQHRTMSDAYLQHTALATYKDCHRLLPKQHLIAFVVDGKLRSLSDLCP